MQAHNPLASISFVILTSRISDGAADSSAFATLDEAHAAVAIMAREHIATHEADYHDMLSDAQWTRRPPLAELTDDECVEIANAWDGVVFETDISPATLTLPLAQMRHL